MAPAVIPVMVAVPATVPPARPVIPVEIAVAAAEATSLGPALLAQLANSPAVALDLMAVEAVPLNVALKLDLRTAEAHAAVVVPVVCLSRPAGQQASTQEHRSA